MYTSACTMAAQTPRRATDTELQHSQSTKNDDDVIAFGPVPSRRLGQSLGINNIPPKICSYACVYCQLGNTLKMQRERQAFYEPRYVADQIARHAARVRARNEPINYLTFVSDGEPTLDANLGTEIELVRPLQVKTAVITNGSLIDRQDVRDDLALADLVSVSIDAVSEDAWRRVNRPHGLLRLERIREGIAHFASSFAGQLITETQLVRGINDGEDEIAGIAALLAGLRPARAYVAIPTRPPAEQWVRPAAEDAVNLAYQAFSEALGSDRVEYLVGYEGNAFASTGDARSDLLSITAVHPMRRDAVEELLDKNRAQWDTVATLISDGRLVELVYEGNRYYMRALQKGQ